MTDSYLDSTVTLNNDLTVFAMLCSHRSQYLTVSEELLTSTKTLSLFLP